MKFDVVGERTVSMYILISWNGVLKWHRLKTQPSLPPTMLSKRNAQIIWFSNQNFPWKFRSVCRYCMLFWLPLFLKTLTNAQKAPAVAVNCATTTTEVLRVIVGAGTGYKAIKNLVLVSILIKSNYVELTCQMICISLISWTVLFVNTVFLIQMCQLLKWKNQLSHELIYPRLTIGVNRWRNVKYGYVIFLGITSSNIPAHL